jgi:ribosomal protein L7/L12
MTQPEELKLLIATGRKIEAVRVLRENEGLSLTEAKQRVDELNRRST